MTVLYIINLFCIALSAYFAGVSTTTHGKLLNLAAAGVNIIAVVSHLAR